MRLSALMQVYNEELCLPCSLPGLLAVVDECIIIDGGADGPSTDGSRAIIDEFDRRYPGKIIYLSGAYLREDGAWDEPRQVNDGIARVTGDYLMRTHADMVFDEADLIMVRDIITRFPDKTYFYAPLVDFVIDTDHVMLNGRLDIEPVFRREICHCDPVVLAMSTKPHAAEIGVEKRFGVTAHVDYANDTIYMPHVRRFHYSYCKPMPLLVAKYIRCIRKNDFAEHGERLKALGESAMVEQAVRWVRDLPNSPTVQPYAGAYPRNAEALRAMNIMQGAEQFAGVGV